MINTSGHVPSTMYLNTHKVFVGDLVWSTRYRFCSKQELLMFNQQTINILTHLKKQSYEH